jgi:hypothetical protein
MKLPTSEVERTQQSTNSGDAKLHLSSDLKFSSAKSSESFMPVPFSIFYILGTITDHSWTSLVWWEQGISPESSC